MTISRHIKNYGRNPVGVFSLYVDRLRTAMCEVYKIVNNIGLAYLKKYFTIKDTSYETRTAMCYLNLGR